MKAIVMVSILAASYAAALHVVIQPDSTEGTDTTLKQFLPDDNFGDATGIVIDASSTNGQVFLLRFDLADYSYACIRSATLDLYVFAASGNGHIAINRVTTNWGEMTATWNNAPRYYSNTFTEPVSSMFSWTHIDLTRMVQYWVNHPYQNFGLRGSPVEKGLVRAFRSSDNDIDPKQHPVLTIEYEESGPGVVPVSLGEVKATFHR